jgi:hypothetical protein
METMQTSLTDLSRKKFKNDLLIGLTLTVAGALFDFDALTSSTSKMSAIFLGRNMFDADG